MKVGDRIICINGNWKHMSSMILAGAYIPKKDEEFTIESISLFGGVSLVGIDGKGRGYSKQYFEKIEPLDTKAIAEEFTEVIERIEELEPVLV